VIEFVSALDEGGKAPRFIPVPDQTEIVTCDPERLQGFRKA